MLQVMSRAPTCDRWLLTTAVHAARPLCTGACVEGNMVMQVQWHLWDHSA